MTFESKLGSLWLNRPWAGPAVAALLAVALFAVTVTHGLVLDSKEMLVYGTFLTDPDTGPIDVWSHNLFHEIPGATPRGGYRPLTSTTLWLLPQVGLGAPAFHHALNSLMHGGVTFVLGLLLLEVGFSRALAFAAALLFATHPVHTEPVSYVVGRAEVMMALFAVLGLLLYARALRAETRGASKRLMIGALACGFLAMTSKENGAAVIGLVPIVEGWMALSGRPVRWHGMRRLAMWALWLLPLTVYLLLRHQVLGVLFTSGGEVVVSTIDDLPFRARALFAFAVLAQAWRVMLPIARLSADYGANQIPVPDSLLSFPVLAGLLGAALLLAVPTLLPARSGDRSPAIALLGAAWFLIAWLPTSHLPFPVGEPFAERWLYLPSLGLTVWAIVCVRRLLGDGRAWWIAVGLLASVMAASTAFHVQQWRSPHALTRATAQASPRSVRALYNAGTEALLAGEYVEALEWFDRYFSVAPADDRRIPAALNNQRFAQLAVQMHRDLGRYPAPPRSRHISEFLGQHSGRPEAP